MGFHIKNIEKGILGDSSKILEEINELIDAENQDLKILVLWELSDVIGAINLYLLKHFPGISLQDLIKMSIKNSELFKEGVR